ncbi:MAG: phosphate ABC transporter permease subunit PstC [Sulfolobales archaeon]
MKNIDPFNFFSIGNILIIIFLGVIVLIVSLYSYPIFQEEGIRYVITSAWDPVKEVYGIAFAIGGTLITSFIAIILAILLAIASAVFIIEIAPLKLRPFLDIITDLAATIPTVIYGLWGIYFLAPFVRDYIMSPLINLFPGITSILGYYVGSGASLFTASILLAIMIYPFATSIIREGLRSIPNSIREALYSLGLTKWEVIKHELLYIRSSIITGSLVAFGRAVGETVAVAMVVGNAFNPLFYMIFKPGYTVSSLIANQFLSATGLAVSALYGAALVIFLIGLVVNLVIILYLRRLR